MSSIEMAVRNARAIETLLVERLGASGKGLHEKLNSVEKQLPPHIVKTARWIATLRNSAVHQHDFEISNPDDFMNAAARVLAHLEAMPVSSGVARMQWEGEKNGAWSELRLEPIRQARTGAQKGRPEAILEERRPRRAGRVRRPERTVRRLVSVWLSVLAVVIVFLFLSGKVRIEGGYLLIEAQRPIKLPGF